MSLFINQNDERTKLQQRIAEELQEKAKQRADVGDMPDGVKDSHYLKDTEQTTSNAWIWILLAVVTVLVILSLTAISSTS